VTAYVLRPGVAAAITIKSRHGFDRADIQRLSEHVSGGYAGARLFRSHRPSTWPPLAVAIPSIIPKLARNSVYRPPIRRIDTSDSKMPLAVKLKLLRLSSRT
jgi:hypothetical protein